MIDVLSPPRTALREGGLRAIWESWALAIEAPSRDSARIVESDNPVIWTVVEIEGERPAEPLLLGFSSEARKGLYLLLRSLSGIGRKSAFLVLDCGGTTDILRAAAGEDADFFKQVPGLGAKRIADLIGSLQKKYRGNLPQALPVPVREWIEARDALVQSGRSEREAEKLLHRQEGVSAEELLQNLL